MNIDNDLRGVCTFHIYVHNFSSKNLIILYTYN